MGTGVHCDGKRRKKTLKTHQNPKKGAFHDFWGQGPHSLGVESSVFEIAELLFGGVDT